MRLIDADELPITETWALVNSDNNSPSGISFAPLRCILKKDLDNAPTVEEKDKCSSCKHYDKDYGETCLNPEGTCRVFEYDGYEEAKNDK